MKTKIEFFDKNEFFFRVLKGRTNIVGNLADIIKGENSTHIFSSLTNKEFSTTTTMEIEIIQDYEKYKTIAKNGAERTGKVLKLNFYKDGTISVNIWKS